MFCHTAPRPICLFILLLLTGSGNSCRARQKQAVNGSPAVAIPQVKTLSFDTDYPKRSANTVTMSVRAKGKARIYAVAVSFFFQCKDAPYFLSRGTFSVNMANSEDNPSLYQLIPIASPAHSSSKQYTCELSGRSDGGTIYGAVSNCEATFRSGHWEGVKATLQIGNGRRIFQGAQGTLKFTGDFTASDKTGCHLSGTVMTSAAPVDTASQDPFSTVLTSLFKTDLANTR